MPAHPNIYPRLLPLVCSLQHSKACAAWHPAPSMAWHARHCIQQGIASSTRWLLKAWHTCNLHSTRWRLPARVQPCCAQPACTHPIGLVRNHTRAAGAAQPDNASASKAPAGAAAIGSRPSVGSVLSGQPLFADCRWSSTRCRIKIWHACNVHSTGCLCQSKITLQATRHGAGMLMLRQPVFADTTSGCLHQVAGVSLQVLRSNSAGDDSCDRANLIWQSFPAVGNAFVLQRARWL